MITNPSAAGPSNKVDKAVPNRTQHHQWQVRCLTIPGLDTDLSLYVTFDNLRFLFGCGEGTQRAFVQRRQPWRGLSGIFIGSGGSKARSGLAGELDLSYPA